MASSPTREEQRWVARPVLSRLLRVVLLCTPLVVATVVVRGLAGALPDTTGVLTRLLVLGAVGFLVAVLLERLARRFLPLAALLRLTMLFPDRAPSRFRIARAAGDRQALEQRLARTGDLSAQRASEQVLSLITALGAHDRRTRGHCERVRVFTDLLAEELRLDQDARDRLRWAALLHDIGKLSITATVLNKPAALDAREFGQMKRHPEWGAELAAPLLPWLGEWGLGILEHHERYDGTGYPQGLAATAISPAGRIVGLIDAYETMTAARTYKKAMTTRAAREELASCAGSHFDPAYVRAFLAVSLPRVLWAMGPLALIVQLPFLRSIGEAGARAGAVSHQAGALAGSGAVAAAGVTGVLLTSPPPVEVPEPQLAVPASSVQAPAAVVDPAPAAAPAPVPAAVAPAPQRPPSAPQEQPDEREDPADPAQVVVAGAEEERRPATSPPRPAAPDQDAGARPSAGTWTLPPATGLAGGLGGAPATAEARPVAPVARPTVSLVAPEGTIREVDVTVRFTSDTPDVRFECSLDSAGWQPCGSPHRYAGLADGLHDVQVRAVTSAGLQGPAARAAFQVAAVPEIVSGPQGRTRDRTVTFELAAPRTTDRLECRLDDGEWSTCTAQVVLRDLPDGQHRFEVRLEGSTETRKRTFVVNPDGGQSGSGKSEPDRA